MAEKAKIVVRWRDDAGRWHGAQYTVVPRDDPFKDHPMHCKCQWHR